MRWVLRIVLMLVLAAGLARAQGAETRIALIIANETYPGGVFQPLPGTRQDAAAMQTALGRAGFAVTLRQNLDRARLRAELAAFARRLAGAGNNAVGFLYYSGHGVGQRGENYLIPVDAQVQAITDLPLAAVPLGEQLEAIQLSGARATIIVIDACRTSFGRGARGLVAVPARTDTLIAFSTQPGEIAADDGLYARTLAAEIARPGADAESAFTRTQREVARATNRAQVPRMDSGLVEPIVFVAPTPDAGGAPAVRPQPGSTFRDCDVCPEMVVIPGGTFVMGSPDSEPGRSADEGPQRMVRLQSFAAGKYEVTSGEWLAFIRATARAPPPETTQLGDYCVWDRLELARNERFPISCVDWQDAQGYVAWLASVTGATYRLLTESEWEYSARAGTQSPYWFGASVSMQDANFGRPNGPNRMRRVGSYAANAFGIYDTAGSVEEWVEDCYVQTYANSPTDGSSVTSVPCSSRVARGGGWFHDQLDLRSADRKSAWFGFRSVGLGFRVARTL